MKTIKMALATTMVLAIIGATPVFCCDWGICDVEFLTSADSLLGLTSRSESCFRSLRDELSDLCRLYGSPLHNLLFGPSCCDPDTNCGQRFRQDLNELLGILYSVPKGTRNFSQQVRIIFGLICGDSGVFPQCNEDYLKDTRKLMKLMSPKQVGITLPGTFEAGKEAQKGGTSNRLLDTLAQADPDRFMAVRMVLADAQLAQAALRSNTNLFMLAAAMGEAKTVEALANGEDVNAQNNTGKTALMFAASEGRLTVVETLLKAGADPNLKDKEGDTAASLAKKKDHYDVLKILEQASVKNQDRLSD
ncbi:MAG: ankyrin repeat domain-containing protein [Pseudomonadota bacterium]